MPAKSRNDDTSRASQVEYSGNLGVISLWDMSRHPTTGDDLLRKMGRAAKTRGGAIVDMYGSSGRSIWADGLTNSRKEKQSIWPFDPDNWVLRYFDTKELDEFGAWSVRLVADHSNHGALRAKRSTQVTDCASDQLWGWLDDVMRVTEPSGGFPVFDPSLKYNAAGMLPDFSEEIRTLGKANRGVLATPIFRNIGHTTDGGHVGQWSQIFTFPSPAPAPTVATSKGNSKLKNQGTVTEDKIANEPPIPPHDGARPSSPKEMCLRVDAKIRTTEGLARFVPEKLPSMPPESGEARLVHVFCLAELAPSEDAGLDSATDPQTNVTKIPKDAIARKVAGYVRVPKPGYGDSHRYDYSYHSPPPPPSSSSSGSAVATGGGPTPPAMGQNPDGTDPNDIANEAADDSGLGPSDGSSPEGAPDTEAPAPEAGAPTEGADHGYSNSPPYSYPDQDPAGTADLLEQLEQEASDAFDARAAQ